MNPQCEAVIVTCIDFRFQQYFEEWAVKHFQHPNYDRVAIAGGVKNWDVLQPQISIARKLHSIEQVILINHEDCGAYGEEGTVKRHRLDLKLARERVLEHYPELKVKLYFVHADGEFEAID